MMNKNLSVVLLFLAIALLVFATSAFALTNEDVSLDEEGFDVLGGSSSGNFLMSTDNGEAIFWGTYNGTSQTLSGTVLWMSNAIIRVGTGAYSPTSSNSGSISLHFYDPMNSMDPGMNWVGNYNSTVWTISDVTNTNVSLSGTVFLAPN